MIPLHHLLVRNAGRVLLLFVGFLVIPFCIASSSANPLRTDIDDVEASLSLELEIWGDAELRKLDQRLKSAYRSAVKKHPACADEIKESQVEWLSKRGLGESSEDITPQFLQSLKEEFKIRILLLSTPQLSDVSQDRHVRAVVMHLKALVGSKFRGEAMLEFARLYAKDLDREEESTKPSFECRAFEIEPKVVAALFAPTFDNRIDSEMPLCDVRDVGSAVTTFLATLSQIKGDGLEGPRSSSYQRSIAIAETLAALDPNPDFSVVSRRDDALAARWKKYGFTPSLEHWGLQGEAEKQMYHEYREELQVAEAELTSYYQERFDSPANTAKRAAAFYMRYLTDTYMDAKYGDLTPQQIIVSYPSRCWGLEDLRFFLKRGKLPENRCPDDPYSADPTPRLLSRLLRLAIVNDFSIGDITKLLEAGAPVSSLNSSTTLDCFWSMNEAVDAKIYAPPLVLAANRPDVLELLLARGANPREADESCKTPLMCALENGNADSVRVLLKNGADMNARARLEQREFLSVGPTALEYAAGRCTAEIINLLLANGADVTAKDSHGKSALYYLTDNPMITDTERDALLTRLAQPSPTPTPPVEVQR
jgi:uncharacterized protein